MAHPRNGWARSAPEVVLSNEELAELLVPVFPSPALESVERLSGGLCNTHYRVTLADRPEPVVVRISSRGPEVAAREIAVQRLVAGTVPVAEVIHFSPSSPVGRPVCVTRWIAAQRLDQCLSRMEPPELEAVGHDVGGVLARIGRFRFETAGFLSERAEVVEPLGSSSETLQHYVHEALSSHAGQYLGDGLSDAVRRLVEERAPMLDEDDGAPHLVHSDFGPSNILVRPTQGQWRVAAVLDWEFALSNTVVIDLGNLFRPPLDSCEPFEQGFLRGFVGEGGRLPERWRDKSLLADVLAWLDLVNRENPGEARIASARNRLSDAVRRLG